MRSDGRSHAQRRESSARAFTTGGTTAAERLDEVARILALGILRLRDKKQSSSSDLREVSLDFAAEQSVHGPRLEADEGRP